MYAKMTIESAVNQAKQVSQTQAPWPQAGAGANPRTVPGAFPGQASSAVFQRSHTLNAETSPFGAASGSQLALKAQPASAGMDKTKQQALANLAAQQRLTAPAGVSQVQVDEVKRLNYIKEVKFVVPQKKVTVVKISLAEQIPFVAPLKDPESSTQGQRTVYDTKRKHVWRGWKAKAQASIKVYLDEMKERISERETLLRTRAQPGYHYNTHPSIMHQSAMLYSGLPLDPAKDDFEDSDEEEFKQEAKPSLNAKQTMEINNNIQAALLAAKNIAKTIESPLALDDGTIEMILYLTQVAISHLKELHQRNKFAQLADPHVATTLTADALIKQVQSTASNAYELIVALESMRRGTAEKELFLKHQHHKLQDAVKNILKEMPSASRLSKARSAYGNAADYESGSSLRLVQHKSSEYHHSSHHHHHHHHLHHHRQDSELSARVASSEQRRHEEARPAIHGQTQANYGPLIAGESYSYAGTSRPGYGSPRRGEAADYQRLSSSRYSTGNR